MGKWFVPNAFRRSLALERTKSPLVWLLLLLIIAGITSKSKHTVKYPDLLSAMRSVPHSEQFSISKPPSNQNVSDDYSNSEDH